MTSDVKSEKPSVKLRTATPADFDTIREIARDARLVSFKHFMTEDEVEDEVQVYYNNDVLNGIINNPANAIYVAERDGQLLGYVSVLPKDRRGRPRLLQMYVRPDYQRQGIGQTLFNQAIEHLREAKQGEMIISTVWENSHGRAFYEKHGARLVQEYDSTWDGNTHRIVVYIYPL